MNGSTSGIVQGFCLIHTASQLNVPDIVFVLGVGYLSDDNGVHNRIDYICITSSINLLLQPHREIKLQVPV